MPVKYISTRGDAPALSFDDVTLTGLAPDGGLYLPESWPSIDEATLREWRSLSYEELAVEVMLPFVGDALSRKELTELASRAYSRFGHRALAPLKQLDSQHFLCELFHGPTLAFKDYALQFVGHLFAHIVEQRGERRTIVGATSGDTGSAAIEACRDREPIDIFILHPHGRVSEVQRRQMTTVDSANVFNIAVEGNFDDCQDHVKAMFGNAQFRDEVGLSAVNSINWARILAQIVYYIWCGLQLGAPDREIAFAVPTGNFGNIFAGYCARKMGLPIRRLVIGSNRNDILTRFVNTGNMKMEPVVPSLSPSMDIQVSSNFERLLFELLGRDGDAVQEWMVAFREQTEQQAPADALNEMRELFTASRYSDEETKQTIRETHEQTAELTCPHSAIGVQAAIDDKAFGSMPFVSLATAHPAKFPDAVEDATGVHPALPDRLSNLFDLEERFETVDNDTDTLMQYIREHRRG
jgi:threonine synthase